MIWLIFDEGIFHVSESASCFALLSYVPRVEIMCLMVMMAIFISPSTLLLNFQSSTCYLCVLAVTVSVLFRLQLTSYVTKKTYYM